MVQFLPKKWGTREKMLDDADIVRDGPLLECPFTHSVFFLATELERLLIWPWLLADSRGHFA